MALRVLAPIPLLERRYGEKDIDRTIEELSTLKEGNVSLELVECAYHMGYFQEAVDAADKIASTGDPNERMVALCVKLRANLALGNAKAAWQAALEAKEAALAGMQSKERSVFWVGVVCAHMIENTSLLSLGGHALEIADAGEMPIGLRAYYGFLLSYRLYCDGEDLQAIGMARGFLTVAGDRYPLSCIKLRLLIAAAYLRQGDIEKAEEEYRAAWDMAHPYGIVGPFIESNDMLPGMARRFFHEHDDALLSLLRMATQRYRKSRCELRMRCCKRGKVGSRLSPLEYSAAMLAIWGWTNKEVAAYLGIAESTVKHYLSSAYQKTDTKNRKQLAVLLEEENMLPGSLTATA